MNHKLKPQSFPGHTSVRPYRFTFKVDRVALLRSFRFKKFFIYSDVGDSFMLETL